MTDKKQVIRLVINELEGVAFEGKYSQKAKEFFEDRYSKIISLLLPVSQNSIGLEIGLCSGVLAFSLKRYLKLKKLYSLEHPKTIKSYKHEFLQKLKKENIICNAVDLRSGKFPWKASTFDFIIFSEVMEHLVPSDLPQIIKGLKKILKESGFLVVTTPNIGSLIKRLNLLRGKNPIEFDLRIHEGGTYGHIREYTLNEVEHMLQAQGFSIKKKGYFEIDPKRNIFSQIENVISKSIPYFSNNLFLIAVH